MDLTQRQQQIVAIVSGHEPVTGEQIAELLSVTRATLRPDLALLTMLGVLSARPRVGYFLAHNNTLKSGLSDILGNARVHDFQGVPIVVMDSTSAYDAVVTLFLEDVGSLFVIHEDGQLAGVVSRKDLLKVAIGQGDLHQMPVSIVMTRMPNLATIRPDDTLLMAARLLIRSEVDSLPVVVEEDSRLQVVGRITKTTITRWLVEHCC